MEEKLYEHYIGMRQTLGELEKMKYGECEDYSKLSEEFKQGFLAGVKILSSMLIDL